MNAIFFGGNIIFIILKMMTKDGVFYPAAKVEEKGESHILPFLLLPFAHLNFFSWIDYISFLPLYLQNVTIMN